MDHATKDDIKELSNQFVSELRAIRLGFRQGMKEQFAAERIYTQTMVRTEVKAEVKAVVSAEISSAFREFIDGPFSNLVEHVDALHDKFDDLARVVRVHSADITELKAVSHKH